MSKIKIKEFKSSEEQEVLGELLIKSADIKLTSNGLQFLTMILTDGEQEIEAKKWNTSEKMFDKGEVVQIRGTKNLYNGNVSIVISEMYKSECDPIEFKKHGPNKAEDCFLEIISVVDTVSDSQLALLTLDILKDNRDLFLTVPSAVGHHHNYEGGNCQHTYEVLISALNEVNISNKLSKLSLDADLVICGAALHDIGKLWCYRMNGEVPEMTTIGKFKDHLVVGSQILNEKAIELGIDRTQEWFMMLDHIILSHHGKLEWGSPVAPCFPEAYIVHQADMNSSNLSAMSKSIEEISGEWGTKRDWKFNSYLYKGGGRNNE